MRLFAYRIALASLIAIAISGLPARAQTHAKKPAHKPKPVAGDANRITRTDLGFSYVMPADYVTVAPKLGAVLELHLPTSDQGQTVAEEKGTNYKSYLNMVLLTRIALTIAPAEPVSKGAPDELTTENAKAIVAALSGVYSRFGVSFNYQNSAKIKVAGHDALAILAESSITGLSDRALLRIVTFFHRGKQYTFAFSTEDTVFETRVTAFENFMASLKFLEPDIAPTEEPKKGPVEIKIDH